MTAKTRRPKVDGRTPAERLRERMGELDLSASEVAELVGVTKSTVTDWLAGRRPIAEERVAPLCRGLSVAPAWLTAGALPKARAYAELTPVERRLVALRRKAGERAAELKALRKEIRAREVEQAEALDVAELAAFHRGQP